MLELPHAELVPFVQAQMKKRTPVVWLYIALNLGLLMFLISLGSWQLRHGVASWDTIFSNFAAGLALGIGLLFPHEALHAIAYKLVGARLVSFGGQWRRFVFYALANRFVANRQEFLLVAFMPFVVLSAGLGLTALTTSALSTSWICLGGLLLHTALCSGDFALASYMVSFPNTTETVTYDDTAAQTTHFLTKAK